MILGERPFYPEKIKEKSVLKSSTKKVRKPLWLPDFFGVYLLVHTDFSRFYEKNAAQRCEKKPFFSLLFSLLSGKVAWKI